jgi:hypothetical protein
MAVISNRDTSDHQELDTFSDECSENSLNVEFRQGADGVRTPPPAT